jgi:hypothetical protein
MEALKFRIADQLPAAIAAGSWEFEARGDLVRTAV